jgi:hypothetical protein
LGMILVPGACICLRTTNWWNPTMQLSKSSRASCVRRYFLYSFSWNLLWTWASHCWNHIITVFNSDILESAAEVTGFGSSTL